MNTAWPGLAIIYASSPALAEMLELDRQLNGATFWYRVNMGHHHWLHNQRDSADPHFRQARKIAVSHGLAAIPLQLRNDGMAPTT